jgi:hypothetical protein
MKYRVPVRYGNRIPLFIDWGRLGKLKNLLNPAVEALDELYRDG